MDIWVVSTSFQVWITLLWTFMHTFLRGHVFFSWVYRSRIGRSYGNYVFNFLRYHRTLPKLLHHFTFREAVYEGSISPHPHQHLLFCLFDSRHASVCEMVSHYGFDLHFLLINDVEHLFMCLLAFYISSLEKCIPWSFAHFKIGLFVFIMKL